MDFMYSFWTVSQLKDELKRRKASTAGKKADLIERLEAYDRNANFGADSNDEEDTPYHCPPTETFRDLNADSSIPYITGLEIQQYFERCQCNAHRQGQLLYECRHLLNARYSSVGTYTYVRGECKASMKKVVYVVNVKLNAEGSIEEAHCECAAGNGTQASCKHVAVLLLGVQDIVQNKIIKLNLSCTQQLMTIKKPKKVFYHSPISAQNLPSKRMKGCNYNPIKNSDILDNYEDYVRNLIINHGETTMPILQTIEPANPYGLESDHYSCLKKTPNDIILEDLLLKNVSLTKIQHIEEITRAQDESPEWHKMRACRITASMFYVVTHTRSSFNSILQRILQPKPIQTRAMLHGKIHEPIAIDKYEADFKLKVQRCGLFISKENPFLAASPDGLLGTDTVIEVKCPYASRNFMIDAVTVPYLKNENGQLKLKENHPYYAQVQGQLYCTERKFCNFIVYTFKDAKVLFINRNETYINQMLCDLTNFYVHHLEPAVVNKYVYKNYSLIKRK